MHQFSPQKNKQKQKKHTAWWKAQWSCELVTKTGGNITESKKKKKEKKMEKKMSNLL